MDDWIKVAQLADVPVLGARIYRHNEGEIAIFRTAEDKVFALNNRCPHKGGPLSEGIVHGGQVTCPLHNWQIDLATGEAQGADTGCTERFEVKVAGEDIFLRAVNAKA